MSAKVNINVLKNFIVKTTGSDKLTKQQAQKYGINGKEFEKLNKDENEYLGLDEMLKDSKAYEQFATMFVEDADKKADAKADKEKKEEKKVNPKAGA